MEKLPLLRSRLGFALTVAYWLPLNPAALPVTPPTRLGQLPPVQETVLPNIE